MTELTLGWPNQPWLPELLPDLKATSSQEMFDEKNPVGIFSIKFHIDLKLIKYSKHDLSRIPENQDPMLIVAPPSPSLAALK